MEGHKEGRRMGRDRCLSLPLLTAQQGAKQRPLPMSCSTSFSNLSEPEAQEGGLDPHEALGESAPSYKVKALRVDCWVSSLVPSIRN